MRSAVCAWVVLALVCGATTFAADEERGGTVVGKITAKSSKWIDVRADGAEESARYLPFWRGGLPKDGGGFDKEMLAAIAKLGVGDRVRLVWKFSEHNRIVSIEKLAPHEGDHPAEGGTVTGAILEKGETWIRVRADGAEGSAKYIPFWRGGLPKDGGGFDKDMVARLRDFKAGDHVKLVWKFEEHKRIVSIDKVAAEAKDGR